MSRDEYWLDAPEYESKCVCPNCGEPFEKIYHIDYEVFGCDNCMEIDDYDSAFVERVLMDEEEF